MLLKAKDILKASVKARDGDIGAVKDLYLDDLHWAVRYLVVEAGSLLKRHQVLISPESINRADWPELTGPELISVDLTHQQIAESPSIDSELPVSRQREDEVRRYFGWPAYWGAPMYAGLYPAGGLPLTVPPPEVVHSVGGYVQTEREIGSSVSESARTRPPESKGDPHLRSVRQIIGYTVAAKDGDIGHIEDLIVESRSWGVAYLVIDTKNWWPGKKVLIAPGWARDVSWMQKTVGFDVDRATIKGAPEYNSSEPLTTEYMTRLHDYYDRPRYADIDH